MRILNSLARTSQASLSALCLSDRIAGKGPRAGVLSTACPSVAITDPLLPKALLGSVGVRVEVLV